MNNHDFFPFWPKSKERGDFNLEQSVIILKTAIIFPQDIEIFEDKNYEKTIL